MSFVSLQFIGFLLVLFAVYYLVWFLAPKYQWVVLLAGSIYFYAMSSVRFLVPLSFSILTTWLFSLLIHRIVLGEKERLSSSGPIGKEEKKLIKKQYKAKRSALLAVCLILNLGILVVVKYLGLFGVSSRSSVWLAAPLGVSFYTFQSIGYCIDVSRGVIEPQRNPLRYALYVSFFPQISQGPIGQYSELAPALFSPHQFEYDKFVNGLERALFGMFKKVVVANQLGVFVDAVYSDPNRYSGFISLFATVMYAFQLYADFSGYMDIAIGVGQCLGIRVSENFSTPYFSRSIAEYWRRWHITLGAWFRDYLYYPVLRSEWMKKLSKKLTSKADRQLAASVTTALGLFITWLFIGIWHGADLSFVLFGLYNGFFVIMAAVVPELYKKANERLHIDTEKTSWKLFQIIRTFAVVCFGYILFRADSIDTVGVILSRVFSSSFVNGSIHGMLGGVGILDKSSWIAILSSLLICFAVEIYEERHTKIFTWLDKQKLPVRWLLLYGIIIMIFLCGDFSGSQANFLYFQF